MRNETTANEMERARSAHPGDPDASPGWYDGDDDEAPAVGALGAPSAPRETRPIRATRPHMRAAGGGEESAPRPSSPRMSSGRHPTVISPYATRRIAAVRPDQVPAPMRPAQTDERSASGDETIILPHLARITRRIPVVAPARNMPGAPAVPARRAPSPVASRASVTDPALRAFCDAPTGKSAAMPRGITVVPGAGRAPQLGMTWRTGRSTRSYWKISAMAVVLVALLAGVVRLVGLPGVGPLNYDGYADAAGQASAASALAGHGVRGALQADAAGNPWQAGAFSVPQLGGGGAAAPGTLAAAPTPVPPRPPAAAPPVPPPASSAPKTATSAPPASGIMPAPFLPWPPSNPWMTIAGHSPYRVYDYVGDPYASAFGQCTWWAQYERRDENFRGMGNARYWAGNAAARGYRVGSVPAPNATVVFQPYVQGASPVGHVAHVMAVYPDGWFLISEMNAFGNGGGWGRVSYRYAHAGPGVSFIY